MLLSTPARARGALLLACVVAACPAHAAASPQSTIQRLRAENATYPQLTQKHGKVYDGLIEARF